MFVIGTYAIDYAFEIKYIDFHGFPSLVFSPIHETVFEHP